MNGDCGRCRRTRAAAHDVPEPGRRPTHPDALSAAAYGGEAVGLPTESTLRIQGFDANSN